MPRVVHFEIYAEEPERAISFYQTCFGWNFTKWTGGSDDYWIINTGPADQPGINGGMLRRREKLNAVSVIGYVCTVDVPDLDETIAAVVRQGGAVALAKDAVPGMGWLAYFTDTEGNIFGAMQFDRTAGT